MYVYIYVCSEQHPGDLAHDVMGMDIVTDILKKHEEP